jgi:tetratricopeptide (TPR) repeat protein
MQATLAAAMVLHQSGKLDSAAQLYREVLRHEQDSADALHLLGVIQHQKGDHAQAIELICKAIALSPSVPAFHANLAEAYRAQGQFNRAVGCCRTALRLWSDYPEARCNLGMALRGLGQLDEAVTQFRQALERKPDYAAAHNALGTLLCDHFKFDEALEHFQKAVEFDPRMAMARSNLGLLLLDRARAEEALPHSQEAVRLEPDLAAAHNNLGNVYRAMNKFVEARSSYAEALRLEPDMAQALANLGLTLQREGKYADALPWLKQAVELKPDQPAWWENLGDLQIDLEHTIEAIDCYERALVLKPDRAITHNSLGWALQEEARMTEAAVHFQTALRLDPELVGARLNMGGLHEEHGDLVAAEAAFRSAIQLQPRFGMGHARLATLLRGKLPQSDLLALEERLAEQKRNGDPHPSLLFGLAQALDGRGDFDRAAECLREANRLALSQAKGHHRDYDPDQHEQFVTNVIEASDQDFFSRLRGRGSDSLRPIFVFGLPRSGTTLIEQVLAGHAKVYGAGELTLVRRSFEAIPAKMGRTEWPIKCLPQLEPTTLRSLAEQQLQWLQQCDDGKAERIIDKMPDNYIYLGLIGTMFPKATLIHCRRDLRDVAVSCWLTSFRNIRWANDPDHLASRFKQYCRIMEHWRKVLPLPLHEVDYADTVNNLDSVARRLVAACGLEWDPNCLEFHRLQRPVRTASLMQVRQPLYQRSVARWKNYERQLGDLFERLPGQN